MITSFVYRAFIALLLSFGSTLAWSQAYPSKPIQLITAFPPATGTDFAARIMAEKLTTTLGQQVTVVNRPGAGGSLAAGLVAAAPADGYTLLFNSSAQTLYPTMYPTLKFDAARDFVGVASVAEVELVLVTSSAKGWSSLADMVASGKAKPGSVTFGSAGVGTSTHLSFERLASAARINALHVPFKGGSEALTEVIGGRVDLLFTSIIGSVTGPIKAKQLVALAITNRKRSSALPDVPTTLEAGFPDSDFTPWVGMLAASATPRAIVERLNQASVTILSDPDTVERMMKAGLVPMPQSTAQFNTQINAEFINNAKLMKDAAATTPSR